LQTTRDWSFLAERQTGDNWYLVGECAGFADPILSAGVSMAHIGAQQLAYTILESDRGELSSDWLKEQYGKRQVRRIRTHISFADYWYTANAQFSELQEFTAALAKANGLSLTPAGAWRWLAQGGFIHEDLTIGVGGFNLLSLRSSSEFLADLEMGSPLEENNVLTLDLAGAAQEEGAFYHQGRVQKVISFVRDGRVLPLWGQFGIAVQVLQRENRLPQIMQLTEQLARAQKVNPMRFLTALQQAIDAMVRDGWIKASYDPRLPLAGFVHDGTGFRLNTDTGPSSEK
jgi:hypothetical protein